MDAHDLQYAFWIKLICWQVTNLLIWSRQLYFDIFSPSPQLRLHSSGAEIMFYFVQFYIITTTFLSYIQRLYYINKFLELPIWISLKN